MQHIIFVCFRIKKDLKAICYIIKLTKNAGQNNNFSVDLEMRDRLATAGHDSQMRTCPA